MSKKSWSQRWVTVKVIAAHASDFGRGTVVTTHEAKAKKWIAEGLAIEVDEDGNPLSVPSQKTIVNDASPLAHDASQEFSAADAECVQSYVEQIILRALEKAMERLNQRKS